MGIVSRSRKGEEGACRYAARPAYSNLTWTIRVYVYYVPVDERGGGGRRVYVPADLRVRGVLANRDRHLRPLVAILGTLEYGNREKERERIGLTVEFFESG